MKPRLWTAAGIAAMITLTVTACGSGSGNSGGNNTASGGSSGSGGAKGTIALLLPDTTSSPRWETQDKPDFEKEVKKLDPNAKVIYENAQASSSTQQQQAESAMTNGAKVLVICPVDSKAAATIVNEAHQQGVKVISYDRMITNSPVDYYVSFDNEKVGELQGQYIADHTKKGGTIVMIDGAATDNNALQFKAGAHKVLDPLIKKGTFKLGYESMTPDWDPSNALREMEQAMTRLNNHVDGVLAANDSLAGAVIQALKAQGLAGKVPVTGQDATNAGLHDIMQGTQSMTVYKAVPKETSAAAQLAVDLLAGKKPASSLVSGSVNNGTKDVPAVLLQPVAVTKSNIQSTVIKDGYTTMEQIKHPSS
ncbi:sugar ABC transporter substrate-binding protein [Alicyclobacillus shizuokensis]|uniref:sugar ABC transporter substrate-binding protein n=1 Tax=Alicyclobacillus shizuokensis TaxID=392014 RepID=UPI00082A9C97|nr:sugar ABC transporter substrate-binding protein [Alicyclobacillus shizuokensis]